MAHKDLPAIRRLDGSTRLLVRAVNGHRRRVERAASGHGGRSRTQRPGARVACARGAGDKSVQRAFALDEAAARVRHDDVVHARRQMRPPNTMCEPGRPHRHADGPRAEQHSVGEAPTAEHAGDEERLGGRGHREQRKTQSIGSASTTAAPHEPGRPD